jgi:hypothetical protein
VEGEIAKSAVKELDAIDTEVAKTEDVMDTKVAEIDTAAKCLDVFNTEVAKKLCFMDTKVAKIAEQAALDKRQQSVDFEWRMAASAEQHMKERAGYKVATGEQVQAQKEQQLATRHINDQLAQMSDAVMMVQDTQNQQMTMQETLVKVVLETMAQIVPRPPIASNGQQQLPIAGSNLM